MVFQHRLFQVATRSPETARLRESLTHAAALVIPGERTGVAAKLGERRFFKVALPETESNHNIFRLAQL